MLVKNIKLGLNYLGSVINLTKEKAACEGGFFCSKNINVHLAYEIVLQQTI